MVTYAEFVQNISKAKELIQLASFKEFMLQIDALIQPFKDAGLRLPRPLGILPSPEDVRMLIKNTSDNIYEVGLPQVLVYCVSCLEAYLKDQHDAIMEKLQIASDGRLGNFQNVESIRSAYRNVLNRDMFEGDEELANNLNQLFQKRHVIIHNGGIIDEKACERAG